MTSLIIAFLLGVCIGSCITFTIVNYIHSKKPKPQGVTIETQILIDNLIERADYWARTTRPEDLKLVYLLNEIAGALKYSLSNTPRQ